jgi:hypothetical protein
MIVSYEGVLMPYLGCRRKSFPPLSLRDLLDNVVVNCRTRVAVITEKDVDCLSQVFADTAQPELWGWSGASRLLPDGVRQTFPLDGETQEILAKADVLLENEGLSHLVRIEPGRLSMAWSGLRAVEAGEARVAARRALGRLGHTPNLVLAETSGSIELRLHTHVDRVIHTLIEELPPEAPVAFLGSDHRDVNRYRALRDRLLDVLVTPLSAKPEADVCLRPPDQLLDFFTHWVCARGEGR